MTGFEINDYELAENPAARCAVALTVDVSGSMAGEPIRQLNDGIRQFIQEVSEDETASLSVELAIIGFSDVVTVNLDFQPVDPAASPTLTASGSTSLGQGLDVSMDLLRERKNEYKRNGISYYQPWLVLMTDGGPTDDWHTPAQKVHDLVQQKKLSFFGIGIGDRVDMHTLSKICPPSRPPAQLRGLRFREFFQWLSASMQRVSGSATNSSVSLPEISGWGEIAV
jgi:uncharacterized protein YegL